jgi:hypothetical protein
MATSNISEPNIKPPGMLFRLKNHTIRVSDVIAISSQQ